MIASAKHWLLNEQEWRRNPGDLGEAMSSNVDDRSLCVSLYGFLEEWSWECDVFISTGEQLIRVPELKAAKRHSED